MTPKSMTGISNEGMDPGEGTYIVQNREFGQREGHISINLDDRDGHHLIAAVELRSDT